MSVCLIRELLVDVWTGQRKDPHCCGKAFKDALRTLLKGVASLCSIH